MKAGIAARRSRAASWARLFGALAVPVLALAALGNRIGAIPPEALIPLLVAGFGLALVALGLGIYALTDIWDSGAQGAGGAIAGIIYALPVLALLGLVAIAALANPRLTDVTTDLNDPPAFESPGDPAAAQSSPQRFAVQEKAYPELTSRLYPLPIADVYSSVRGLVEDRQWLVTREVAPASLPVAVPSAPAAAAPDSGQAADADAALNAKATMTQSRSGIAAAPARPAPATAAAGEPATGATDAAETAVLQAVARTLVFGFADDVVLRLKETPQGTQVDMRSASRTGLHDLGQNARRIKGFFAALDLALQPDPNAPPPAAPAATADAAGISDADAAKAAELAAE